MATKLTEEASAITTVSQLLAAVEPGLSAPMRAVVKTMVGHLSRCLDTPLNQMPVGALIDADHVLPAYLREQQCYKQSSIDSYRKAARFIFRCAKRLECLSQNAEIPEDWQSIFAAAKTEGCAQIVRYAIRQGISSAAFSDRDLDRWSEILTARKRQGAYATSMKNLFRSVIRRYDLSGALPLVSPQRNYRYGIPTASMSSTLQQEIKNILAFKQGLVWARGLPRRARQGPVTAAGLEGEFCQLYGFAVRILGLKIDSLADLVTERIVTEFTSWLINERKVFRQSVILKLASIHAGVRYYVTFRSTDFRWLQDLIAEIEPEPDSERQERKRRKCLPYEVVEAIPAKLRECRNSVSKASNPLGWAFLLHDELLMTWLLVLPWRRRNLCECKLGLQDEGANLFMVPLSATADIDLPASVEARLRVNPNEPFWQYRFLASQMKKKRMIRGALPIQIAPILEEYLPYRRDLLARTGQDHDRLFLDRDGKPLAAENMTALVKKLTLRYAGREISPHLFRSIVAYQYLRENPRDYLALGKILGHTDPGWTPKIYGSNFDESSGVCVMEAWLLRRHNASCRPEEKFQITNTPTLRLNHADSNGARRADLGTELMREHSKAPASISAGHSANESVVDAGIKQKAKNKVMSNLGGAAARAKGIRLFHLAGKPTRKQLIALLGERGPEMTWQERAKAVGLPSAEAAAVGFQAALAAKLAAAG